MNRNVRRATLAVTGAVIEGLDLTTVVIGGAIGAWAGYTSSPGTWTADGRLAFAGGIAVVAAVIVNSVANLALTPLRRLLAEARTADPQTTDRTRPTSATVAEGLLQAAAATEDDAALRAAWDSGRIDQSDGFLRDEDRWRGYENGEASFFLAPGVWLHYRSEINEHGTRKPVFTLLAGHSDQPVPIRSVQEIRHQLAALAAGLPAATEDQGDVLADDLTGLHATA